VRIRYDPPRPITVGLLPDHTRPALWTAEYANPSHQSYSPARTHGSVCSPYAPIKSTVPFERQGDR